MNKKEKELLENVQINILEEIKRICKKNNINFFLIGGTCLGAVRHNGFIPWDDDVDIGMLRCDYERFIKVCKKDLDKKYYLQTNQTDDDYPHFFCKIRANNTLFQEKLNVGKKMHQGIFVDVFPFDYGSNHNIVNMFLEVKSIFIREAIFKKLGYNVIPKNAKEKIMLPFIKLYSKINSLDGMKEKINKMISKTNKKKSNKIINLVGYALFNDIYNADIFNEFIEHKFKNKTYKIFKNYDEYLTTLYGDYMTPPPEEERKIGHGVIKLEFNTKSKKGF